MFRHVAYNRSLYQGSRDLHASGEQPCFSHAWHSGDFPVPGKNSFVYVCVGTCVWVLHTFLMINDSRRTVVSRHERVCLVFVR